MCPPYLFVSALPALVLRFSPDLKSLGMQSLKLYILEIEVEDRMEILIFEALILNLWHDGDTVTFSLLTNAALRQKWMEKNVTLKNVNVKPHYVALLIAP